MPRRPGLRAHLPTSSAAEGPKSRALLTPETNAGSGQEGGRPEPECGPRGALGTSSTCAGHGEQPAPLRGGVGPRTLSPARTAARRATARALQALPLSERALASYLGLASDRAGAELRAGARPLDVGEALQLLPLDLAIELAAALLRPRLGADPLERLAASHLDALAALGGLRRAA